MWGLEGRGGGRVNPGSMGTSERNVCSCKSLQLQLAGPCQPWVKHVWIFPLLRQTIALKGLSSPSATQDWTYTFCVPNSCFSTHLQPYPVSRSHLCSPCWQQTSGRGKLWCRSKGAILLLFRNANSASLLKLWLRLETLLSQQQDRTSPVSNERECVTFCERFKPRQRTERINMLTGSDTPPLTSASEETKEVCELLRRELSLHRQPPQHKGCTSSDCIVQRWRNAGDLNLFPSADSLFDPQPSNQCKLKGLFFFVAVVCFPGYC